MSLRGTLAVAAYSLAGGAFRYTAEEPLSQFWWSLTCMRIGCTLALERALAAKHGSELRGDDAEDESDGAAEEDIDDDFDDDEDA